MTAASATVDCPAHGAATTTYSPRYGPRCPGCTQEQHQDILTRVTAGETLQAVADDYGYTRERIRQIVAAADPTIAKRNMTRRTAERRRQRAAERAAERAKALAALAPCAACLGPVRDVRRLPRPGETNISCSPRCHDLWARVRNYLDPHARESHLRSVARHKVANPAKYRPIDVASARRVLDGTSRRNQRAMPYGAKVRAALAEVARLRGVPVDELLRAGKADAR